jgi:hypothetical protein
MIESRRQRLKPSNPAWPRRQAADQPLCRLLSLTESGTPGLAALHAASLSGMRSENVSEWFAGAQKRLEDRQLFKLTSYFSENECSDTCSAAFSCAVGGMGTVTTNQYLVLKMMRAFEQAGGSTAALFQSVGSSPNLLISPSTEFFGFGCEVASEFLRRVANFYRHHHRVPHRIQKHLTNLIANSQLNAFQVQT